MALKVKDILQLQSLQGLKLISGASGLERVVCSAGIADYEFARGVEYHNDTPFDKESFVISSLLFAQNDKDQIFTAVKELYRAGTSAFAFKDVVFDKLPQEVLDFSNEMGYPIFSFGQNVYFENIIYEIMDAVQRDDTEIFAESNIKMMIEKQLPKEDVLLISKSISLLFKQYAQAVYVKHRPDAEKLDTSRILRNFYLDKSLKNKCILCRFDGGVFIIITSAYKDEDKFEVILQQTIENLSIDLEQVFICRSSIYRPYESLDACFRESYHTWLASKASNVQYETYDRIGQFQYLVPLRDNPATRQFAESMLQPLLDKEEFLYTVLSYVKNNGDITVTAVDCKCHQNTIRYRLTKVKELLGAENKSEPEFYADLSTAVRISLLLEKEFLISHN